MFSLAMVAALLVIAPFCVRRRRGAEGRWWPGRWRIRQAAGCEQALLGREAEPLGEERREGCGFGGVQPRVRYPARLPLKLLFVGLDLPRPRRRRLRGRVRADERRLRRLGRYGRRRVRRMVPDPEPPKTLNRVATIWVCLDNSSSSPPFGKLPTYGEVSELAEGARLEIA